MRIDRWLGGFVTISISEESGGAHWIDRVSYLRVS